MKPYHITTRLPTTQQSNVYTSILRLGCSSASINLFARTNLSAFTLQMRFPNVHISTCSYPNLFYITLDQSLRNSSCTSVTKEQQSNLFTKHTAWGWAKAENLVPLQCTTPWRLAGRNIHGTISHHNNGTYHTTITLFYKHSEARLMLQNLPTSNLPGRR